MMIAQGYGFRDRDGEVTSEWRGCLLCGFAWRWLKGEHAFVNAKVRGCGLVPCQQLGRLNSHLLDWQAIDGI